MKQIKKYAVIGIIIAIAALGILQLVNNKKRLDNELQAMQQYSMVVPVEVIPPERQGTSQHVTENGVLTSGSEITILSETSGKVLSVNGNIGDKVYAGQILVTVEKELVESQFQLAKTNLEHAEKDLARYDSLAEGEAVTQQQLEAVKLKYRDAQTQFTASKKQLENTTIRSPVNGVIANRLVEKGTTLLPSIPIFTIAEQDRMVFTVNMAEEDVRTLGRERKAEIFIDASPENSFTGNIRGISTVPDLSGRYKVEMELNNPSGLLRAGMSGKAVFTSDTDNEGLVIPRKCVVGSVRDGKIFIVQGDTVISKQVKGRTLNEAEVLITEGVTETDRIVLSGQINLEDGSKIRILNQ
ncbi:efflux RND transporter periplasmic adaptor subunit [Proteiniphilum acetatigenes]|uniref:efflux RND transporter periplasmic adaptor subunit n=1 Tax=Proteiniphilum acetatigenes TaxID=294710 RepID=UPI00036519CA|nr:efflux RND transporter periplasmic adaptor subunit [Proteiniphilum acetatigenes]SFK82672.1 RND family efflux transporter, MFP subunit [Porphyromonadaceae bacterium KH3CP3RA]